MLKILDNNFVNSSLKTKIELYIFPILLIFLFYMIFQNGTKKDIVIEPKIDFDYSKMEFKESFLELFSNLEEYALNNQIQIFNLTNNKRIVFLKAKSDFVNIENLIHKIENLNNFTDIKVLKINKQELNNYLVEIEIDLNKFYIKRVEKEEQNSQNIKEYKLKAIVFDYAFINEIWIKKSEKIDDFELKQIEKDFVVLQKENHDIKLELNNEPIKNFN
jgi:hypothetical protein